MSRSIAVAQPLQAVKDEAAPPLPYGRWRYTELSSNLTVGPASRTTKDDPRAGREVLRRCSAPHVPLQDVALLCRQHEWRKGSTGSGHQDLQIRSRSRVDPRVSIYYANLRSTPLARPDMSATAILLVFGACVRATALDPEIGPPVATTPVEPPVTDCIARYALPDGESVLDEQRRVGPAWGDFPTRYRAAPIVPGDGHVPVGTVSRFSVEQRPLLWFSPDRTEAHVDAAWLSDLTVVDVPRLAVGEVVVLGSAGPELRATTAPRQIVDFLLHADVLRTYWHVGSELCLTTEETLDGAYRALFRGEHVYFTSEENRVPLAFAVAIGADGVLTVRGP
jgi:hypothetical protein